MSQTFFPLGGYTELVPSTSHGVDVKYKVSIGHEMWGNNPKLVLKVQMEYKGKVEGRKSPSYPIGSNDAADVCKAIDRLMARYNKDQQTTSTQQKP
ncbi:MAG: hypothetical protein HZA22_05510 [Nitrospirae bacterium]|nr:hypothetical protein [Nitrospirota bacterium]